MLILINFNLRAILIILWTAVTLRNNVDQSNEDFNYQQNHNTKCSLRLTQCYNFVK